MKQDGQIDSLSYSIDEMLKLLDGDNGYIQRREKGLDDQAKKDTVVEQPLTEGSPAASSKPVLAITDSTPSPIPGTPSTGASSSTTVGSMPSLVPAASTQVLTLADLKKMSIEQTKAIPAHQAAMIGDDVIKSLKQEKQNILRTKKSDFEKLPANDEEVIQENLQTESVQDDATEELVTIEAGDTQENKVAAVAQVATDLIRTSAQVSALVSMSALHFSYGSLKRASTSAVTSWFGISSEDVTRGKIELAKNFVDKVNKLKDGYVGGKENFVNTLKALADEVRYAQSKCNALRGTGFRAGNLDEILTAFDGIVKYLQDESTLLKESLLVSSDLKRLDQNKEPCRFHYLSLMSELHGVALRVGFDKHFEKIKKYKVPTVLHDPVSRDLIQESINYRLKEHFVLRPKISHDQAAKVVSEDLVSAIGLVVFSKQRGYEKLSGVFLGYFSTSRNVYLDAVLISLHKYNPKLKELIPSEVFDKAKEKILAQNDSSVDDLERVKTQDRFEHRDVDRPKNR